MIRELSALGEKISAEKYGKWKHVALKEEFISIDIVIDRVGQFYKFEVFDKKGTITEAITAKKGKARLLVDKAEEVLCYGGELSIKKHELFLRKLDEYSELAVIKPVIAFYQGNKAFGLDKALDVFETSVPDEKVRMGNICFRVKGEGGRIHEDETILEEIIRKHDKRKFLPRQCSICGKSDYSVEDLPHGMIKKVPDGQSSGSALISYNENAFESYGLEGNDNSSVCTNCAKTYVEGLNWLLSSGNETFISNKKGKEKRIFRYTNRRNFGSDTAMVFWTRENTLIAEIDQLESPDPGEVTQLIESVMSGAEQKGRYLESDYFYSFTLSGAAARISVRDWIQTSLPTFRKSIVQWFQDIAIIEYDSNLNKTKTKYASLYELARSCQRANDDKDVSLSRTAAYLWNAALKGASPPLWILTKLLQRARMDEYGVTSERAAIIRLILNRHNRNQGGAFVIAEKLEEGKKPVAYVCGQIFSKFERIQYAALGKRDAGIRERYFTFAMTTPAMAFGRLFNLSSKHLTKLKNEKPGLAIILDKELQELCRGVDIHGFPATFSLEGQGQFAIGYYHQAQEQFNLKPKSEEA